MLYTIGLMLKPNENAIELKEEILARREWDDDGTLTRDFIHRLIMKERAPYDADFERPARQHSPHSSAETSISSDSEGLDNER